MYPDQANAVQTKLEKDLPGLQFFVAGLKDDPQNLVVVGFEVQKQEVIIMVINPNNSEEWIVVFWANGEQQQGEVFKDMYSATGHVVERLKATYG